MATLTEAAPAPAPAPTHQSRLQKFNAAFTRKSHGTGDNTNKPRKSLSMNSRKPASSTNGDTPSPPPSFLSRIHTDLSGTTENSSPASSVPTSPAHRETLHYHYPLHIPEHVFVQQSYDRLAKLGFDKSNTLPCVSLCRDELTAPMLDLIDKQWVDGTTGCNPFVMHSLAGMLFLGKTGFSAAEHHAPIDEKGVARYAFYVFSHIGVNNSGEIGKVKRHGIHKDSGACGALIAFYEEFLSGYLTLDDDPDDIEQSHLKQRIIKKIKFGDSVPSLVHLTELAHQVGLEDLERLINLTILKDGKGSHCDYAVFSGVQLNAGARTNYISPGPCYAVVSGKRHDLTSWSEEN